MPLCAEALHFAVVLPVLTAIHQVRARLRVKVTKVKPPVMVLPDQVLREDRPRCIVAFLNAGSPIPMPYF